MTAPGMCERRWKDCAPIMPDPIRDQPLSMTRRIVVVLLSWGVVYGPIGVLMYGITTFLFAFSGGQVRMVPVVNAGFWIVLFSGLIVGMVPLVRGWSVGKTIMAMLLGAGLSWLLAVIVYWRLSFQLGAGMPPAS